MQKIVQQFTSECGKAKMYVENDMPIGIFHDFLMMLKGMMVDRMVQAHKEQVDQAELMKQLPDEDDESQESAEELAVSCADLPCNAEE